MRAAMTCVVTDPGSIPWPSRRGHFMPTFRAANPLDDAASLLEPRLNLPWMTIAWAADSVA
jgi:hypothetical protein